jgi:transposase
MVRRVARLPAEPAARPDQNCESRETPETLRKWIRQAEIDSGSRQGVTSEESAEVRKLRAENRELRRANEILKAASIFFAAELDRPLR